jgi:aryl-alcohol dehydrogenase-like predicted oxidoreductase
MKELIHLAYKESFLMKYRDFGNTGIKVSEIGFGSWPIGGNSHGMSYGPTDDKDSQDALNKAFELGCNFFDTADVYGWGHSEELLGKTFKSKRDKVIIATKVGADFYQGTGFQTFTRDYIRFALNKSLTRLKTDYLDVYQLHNPPMKLLGNPETYQALEDLKHEGRIRAWGVSVFTPVEGMTAINIGHPDCIQISYNIFSYRAEDQLFPLALEQGCAVIAREPLANGFLTGKYKRAEPFKFAAGDSRKNWPEDYVKARMDAAAQLNFLEKQGQSQTQAALRYDLCEKAVSTVIVGMKTPAHAEENLQAADLSLRAEDLLKIKELQASGFNLK